jgi:hypothetical protein
MSTVWSIAMMRTTAPVLAALLAFAIIGGIAVATRHVPAPNRHTQMMEKH